MRVFPNGREQIIFLCGIVISRKILGYRGEIKMIRISLYKQWQILEKVSSANSMTFYVILIYIIYKDNI